MKALYFALLLGIASCASCARKPGPPARHAEPISQLPAPAPAPAPGVVVQPPRTLLDKLTGRTPEPQYYPPGTPVVVKGKKSTVTINHVAGNQSNATIGKKATAATGEGAVAIAAEKKAGPVVLADSGAVVQVAASQKGPAAAAGRDATATTIKPPTPWLKYGLWLAGIAGGYWLLFGGGGLWLAALWRRNKSNENQV